MTAVPPRRIPVLVVLVLLVSGLLAPAPVGAARLTVGEKVTYSGGPDQPPKEKDTGVSLKVDEGRGGGGPAGSAPAGGVPTGAPPPAGAPPDADGDDDGRDETGGDAPTGDAAAPTGRECDEFLAAGRADELLVRLEGHDDAVATAWRALALAALGRGDEAATAAAAALAVDDEAATAASCALLPSSLRRRVQALVSGNAPPRP